MSGEDLYALYVQANGEQNIGVDAWEDLGVDDWNVWNRLAGLIAQSVADWPKCESAV